MHNITQKLKTTILIFMLLVLIADWFQYFLYMLINFFNYQSAIPTVDLLLLGSIFLSPLLCSFAVKYRMNPKMLNRIIYICIFALAIAFYTYYLSYFRIGLVLDQNPGLNTISPITGFATGDGNLTKRLMFIVNAGIFVVVLPVFINKISENHQDTEIPSIGIEALIAFAICSLYMGFRGGSMLSTPLRLAIVSMIALGFVLSLEIVEKYTARLPEEKSETQSKDRDQRIPLRIPNMSILAFVFGVLSLGDFGVLYRSNIWFIGIVASAIMIRAIIAPVKVNQIPLLIIKILWVVFLAFYCFAGIIGILIQYLSIIKMAFVVTAAVILSFVQKNTDEKSKCKLPKLIYIILSEYGGLLFFLFALLLYFSQPFTNIAIFILLIVSSMAALKESK